MLRVGPAKEVTRRCAERAGQTDHNLDSENTLGPAGDSLRPLYSRSLRALLVCGNSMWLASRLWGRP